MENLNACQYKILPCGRAGVQVVQAVQAVHPANPKVSIDNAFWQW
jgi:hypothetical protein